MRCEGATHWWDFKGFFRSILEGDPCNCGEVLAPRDEMWPEEWNNLLVPGALL